MTIWTPSLEGRPGPTYKAIAQAIGDAISDGTLSVGDRLPTHRDLAWSLGITVATVTRAYQEARRQGYVEGEVGRGTFVRASPDLPTTETVPRFHLPPLEDRNNDGPVNLSLNFPPPIGQQGYLAQTMAELARAPAHLLPLSDYQHSLGMAHHREAGAQWLNRFGLDVTADQVVITCGGQHGMEMAVSALCRTGDTVLTEPLTYPGMKALAGQWDLKLVPVAMDEDGLCPDALEDAIRAHQPRMLYTMPTLHNPTARTMPEQRRREIAAVVERHPLYVVEDGVYGLLPADRPAPLITHLTNGRGVFIASTSKSMGPGFRIGWIAADADLMPRFQIAMRSSCWMAPPLMSEVVCQWIDQGIADTLVTRMREDVRQRRKAVDAILTADALPGLHNSFLGDPYSYHLWVPLPDHWCSETFADQLHRAGLIVLPAESFAVGRHRPPPALRICFGASTTLERAQEGLQILIRTLQTGPDYLTSAI